MATRNTSLHALAEVLADTARDSREARQAQYAKLAADARASDLHNTADFLVDFFIRTW